MERIHEKLNTFNEALQTLKQGIDLFQEYTHIFAQEPTEKNEQLFTSMRDSMIQRFEYCTDLFWKFLKLYLEEVEKVSLPSTSPRGIIRESVKIRVITEKEGTQSMEMIRNRNLTSHIYHEETAVDIAGSVPKFYDLMKTIIERISLVDK